MQLFSVFSLQYNKNELIIIVINNRCFIIIIINIIVLLLHNKYHCTIKKRQLYVLYIESKLISK